jgi:hypothetical protein
MVLYWYIKNVAGGEVKLCWTTFGGEVFEAQARTPNERETEFAANASRPSIMMIFCPSQLVLIIQVQKIICQGLVQYKYCTYNNVARTSTIMSMMCSQCTNKATPRS